jgi:hypothetical protein
MARLPAVFSVSRNLSTTRWASSLHFFDPKYRIKAPNKCFAAARHWSVRWSQLER